MPINPLSSMMSRISGTTSTKSTTAPKTVKTTPAPESTEVRKAKFTSTSTLAPVKSEDSAVQSALKATKSSDIRDMSSLLSLSSTGDSPKTLEESATELLKGALTSSRTDFTIVKDGKDAAGETITTGDRLMAKFNPLASSEAKLEHDLLMAFCESEFSSENPKCLLAMRPLLTTPTQSEAFDDLCDSLMTQFIADGSQDMVNISFRTRKNCVEKMTELKDIKAQLELNPGDETLLKELSDKRDSLKLSIASAAVELKRLMNDTGQRYKNSGFREDVITSRKLNPMNLVRLKYFDKITEGKTDKKARITAFKKHGEIFRDYQRTLKDPDWKTKLEARKTRFEAITRKKEQASGFKRGTFMFGLYNTVVAPWKSWKA